jgi:RNA polymerase sigma factor (sigma-70 family)
MNFDAPFIDRLREQDPKALKEWYIETFPILMAQAARFFSEESEQIIAVHNTQLKALKHLDRFRPGTIMEAWLATILRHELIDLYRRQKRWHLRILDAQFEASFEPDFTIEFDQQKELQMVENVLALLPKTTRFVFSLCVYEQMKPKEIAEHLQMNIGTVRWHLKSARQTLKKNRTHE